MEDFFAQHITREQIGIEIGPSFNPMAPKRDGWNVVIVDHASASELRQKYESTGVNTANIEEVDVIWNGGSLQESIRAKYNGCFDYIIASHVVEHIPNLVEFFQDCASLLNENGLLLLAVPDKRYTFDYLKPLSTTADLVTAFTRKQYIHPLSTAFTSYFMGCANGSKPSWGKQERVKFEEIVFFLPIEKAYQDWVTYDEKEYVDFHRWIFTQHSFELMIKELIHLELCQLDITNMQSDAARPDFYVCMKKLNGPVMQEGWFQERLGYYKKMYLDLYEQLDKSGIVAEADQYGQKKEISALCAELEEAKQARARLEFELGEIHRSKAWKLALRLRNMRVSMLPEGSPIYRLLLKFFQ